MDTQEAVQQRIGHAIRVIARDKEVTMKALYEYLHMSKQSFFDRLSGKTALTIHELERIAERLDVTTAALLEYAPRDSNPEPADSAAPVLVEAYQAGVMAA